MKAKIDESLRSKVNAKPWTPKTGTSAAVNTPKTVSSQGTILDENIDKQQLELVNSCMNNLGIFDEAGPCNKENLI